jgi:hypothetical protein
MLFDTAHIPNIPAELKAIPRWINWKLVPTDDPNKPKKMPVNVHDVRKNGSSTNPATWGTFDQAVRNSEKSKGTLGIGIVFMDCDTLFGFDIDHCIVDGTLTPEAEGVLRQLKHTYAEYSISNTGVHVYGYGEVKKATKRALGELYGTARFFTVSGRPLPDVADKVAECPPALMQWLTAYLTQGKTEPHLDSGSVRDIFIDEEDTEPPPFEAFATLRDTSEGFCQVYDRTGKNYPSPSEEEMALGRYAVNAHWSDQNIYRLWGAWRAKHGLPVKHVGGYLHTLTVLRSKPQEAPQSTTEASVTDRDMAQAVLADLLPVGITRFVLLGQNNGLYRVEFTSGVTVDIGNFDAMIKQEVWCRVISQHTGVFFPPLTRKKWLRVVNALVALTTVEVCSDMSTEAETLDWLDDYTSDLLQADFSYETLRREATFHINDALCVHLGQFLRHIRLKYSPGLARATLAHRLRLLGYSAQEFTAQNDNGTVIGKTYWMR